MTTALYLMNKVNDLLDKQNKAMDLQGEQYKKRSRMIQEGERLNQKYAELDVTQIKNNRLYIYT